MRLLLSVLILAGSSLTFASDKSHRVATRDDGLARAVATFSDGRATITKHIAGGDIRVTIKTSKTDGSPFKDGFRWGGEGSAVPLTLITSVAVQRGANNLFIPLSAYSDLGDPRQISLKPNAAGFELAITGGDAGVAYNAVLVFKKGWLIRRRVAHGEFPDQAWEETQYAYNTLDN